MASASCAGAVAGGGGGEAWTEVELTRLRGGFEARRDAVFASLAGKHIEVAERRPPLSAGRGAFARDFSYSIANFAMKAFWLDEFLEEANAAIRENCRFYIDDALVRNEHHSFYWSADIVCRLVEFFGANGSRAAGRLDPATESLILELALVYCHDNSNLVDADYASRGTWRLPETENHHAQRFMTVWHFLKLLQERPEYRNRDLACGGSVVEHYKGWTEYFKEYLRERVRKGLFVEVASKGYNAETIKGIYNAYDFADDPELRRLARCVLDLFWASWSEEQIDGVRGGAMSRIYQGSQSRSASDDRVGRWGGFYLGRGPGASPQFNDFTVLTSTYRMPLVVMDLALDVQGRGVFEVRRRVPGAAVPGFQWWPDNRIDPDAGGINRYTWCAPEFVMGTFMVDSKPWEAWSMLFSENRWQGVIFAGHPNARIVPECEALGSNPKLGGKLINLTYNQHWSVQCKGTLITQKLPGSRDAGRMKVWISEEGLTNVVQHDGWVFVEAQGAYAAVRPARGGYSWQRETGASATATSGSWMLCADEWTPVIIEVARKAEVADYEAFRNAVSATERRLDGPVLTYRGFRGDTFVFHADHSRPPSVNGLPVDYAPAMVYDSPFIQSAWNSGRVTIRKDYRELVIDVGSNPVIARPACGSFLAPVALQAPSAGEGQIHLSAPTSTCFPGSH